MRGNFCEGSQGGGEEGRMEGEVGERQKRLAAVVPE